MRGCLLLLCLASLWGDSSSEECVRELQEDTDFPGSDVLQILSPDVHHCQTACTQHHSCLFFTFVRPDWTRDNRHFYCYLKHTSSGKPTKITSLQGVTSGYSLKPCKDISSDGCLSTVYENVDFYGEDFETLFTADYKECQKACTKHPGCQYFTFLSQDFSTPKYSNKCHLKHRRVFPSPPRVTSLNGVTSGFSHRICEGSITDGTDCQHKILTDTDFPGNDFEQVPGPSADYCHFLCNIHPHCTYYSYVRNDLVCFLKHNPNERPYKSKEGIMSGTPTRFCEPLKGDCSKSPYDDVDFPGFDRRFVLLDDPKSCQETCNADPDCQFYTYVHSSFSNPVHRRRCYLKQVITLPVPRKVATLENVVSGFHQRGCQKRERETEDRTECVRELQEDIDFPGSDVLQILSPDVHHCQMACTQHHSCLFFTFVRPDWTRDNRHFYCYLKHTSSGKPTKITSLQGVTSGYSLKPCKDISSDGCLSTVYENVDFYGEDFETLFTADYKECQKACTKHPGCQYFTFLTQDFSTPKYSNKCHLKHRRVFPSPPRVTSLNGVTSGFSHRICEGSITDGADCQHKILTDTDFPGNDFEQVPAPSTDYCHFLCNIHPHCTYYSYVRKDLVCFLKHNPNERPYKSKEGIMSGTPTRFCEPLKGDCSKSPYDNVEFPGFDRRFVLLDDLQSCQETCNADPDCQFYTYVHSSFFDPVHRRRCYLKQVITLPVPRKVATLENVVSGFHQRGCQQRTKENEDRTGLDCGELNSIKGRILGGEDAAPNSWPWQVSIQKRGAGHICGGSIISAQWVITAAHCFDSLNPSVFEVSSGTTDLSEANETHELDQIIKHPDFKEFTFENDICLLKLKRPINFTAAEGPVCLADMKVEEGIWDQKCWVTGWGKLSSGQFPKVLQEAQVPLIKPDTCNPLLQGRLVSNTMVCAGVPEGGVDTCQGDSGGPLVCQADGRWYLTGITSWGMGCGEAQKPGVYTRVSSYNNWIRGVVSR